MDCCRPPKDDSPAFRLGIVYDEPDNSTEVFTPVPVVIVLTHIFVVHDALGKVGLNPPMPLCLSKCTDSSLMHQSLSSVQAAVQRRKGPMPSSVCVLANHFTRVPRHNPCVRHALNS